MERFEDNYLDLVMNSLQLGNFWRQPLEMLLSLSNIGTTHCSHAWYCLNFECFGSSDYKIFDTHYFLPCKSTFDRRLLASDKPIVL